MGVWAILKRSAEKPPPPDRFLTHMDRMAHACGVIWAHEGQRADCPAAQKGLVLIRDNWMTRHLPDQRQVYPDRAH